MAKFTLTEPHKHVSSLTQWRGQVQAILDNLDIMDKELRTFRDLNNSTMTIMIDNKITKRKMQLATKLKEIPPKDRPVDIANNTWCRSCLQ